MVTGSGRGSNSYNTLIPSAKGINCTGVQHSNKIRRSVTVCIVLVLILVISFGVAMIGSIVVSTTVRITTGTVNETVLSSQYISIPSDVTSVSLILPSSASVTVHIYVTDTELTNYTCELQNKSIPSLEGSRVLVDNYNYYGNDEPILLLPGSTINYFTNVKKSKPHSKENSSCPAQLFLFNNSKDYYNYIQPPHSNGSSAVNKSFCLPIGQMNYTFHISTTSLYYVVIKIDTDITVISTVGVHQVKYNVTGLRSECTQSKDTPVCTVHQPTTNAQWYITLSNDNSKDYANIDYKYDTLLYHKYHTYWAIASGVLLVAMMTLIFPLSIGICYRCYKVHMQSYETLG